MGNTEQLFRIAKDISEDIENGISKAGIFYRVFFRCKSKNSLEKKMKAKKYDGVSKRLQDSIGIRITSYFADDIPLIEMYLKNKFTLIESTIDEVNEKEFAPARYNLIFKLPQQHIEEFQTVIKDDKIDCTFELQIRTIFSEGWHEVEHDLRYKYQKDWSDNIDLSRMLNGFVASLETIDWSIISLLDELSYRHYKVSNWEAMIRTKMRMRLDIIPIDENILEILEKHNLKDFFKIDRKEVISNIINSEINFPLNINNLIFYINYKYIKNDDLEKITPEPLLKIFN